MPADLVTEVVSALDVRERAEIVHEDRGGDEGQRAIIGFGLRYFCGLGHTPKEAVNRVIADLRGGGSSAAIEGGGP